MSKVCVVGAGLAGSELAFGLSKSNIKVDLFEARLDDSYNDKVHKTKNFAELVCSNSFRSNELHTASGMLKQELRLLNSLIINVADKCQIPAGGSLTVLRDDFSSMITQKLKEDSNINIISKEVLSISDLVKEYDLIAIASGPLSSPALSSSLQNIIGQNFLYFYDAIAPIIASESIDMQSCFFANRYDDESSDYINIALNKDEYIAFVEALINGDQTQVDKGDKDIFFEGCMPIEVMAKRGIDTLRNGPMRGDGLRHPVSGQTPYAAIQLRKDNFNMYNMVGFQTRLKYQEQDRIFRSLDALKYAEFHRYGSMHRNTYINGPSVLNTDMSLKANSSIYIAGQLSGVEGYIESVGQAFMVSQFIKKRILKNYEIKVPIFSALYSLINYLTNSETKNFQPMKINFGIIPELSDQEKKIAKGKYNKRLAISNRSINYLKNCN